MKMTANGQEMPVPNMPAPKPITVVTSKLGKPLKIEGADMPKGGPFDFSKLMNVSQGMFPGKSVQVGEEWDASPDPKQTDMKVKGKLVSLKKVEGKEMGELQFTINIPGEALTKVMQQGLPAGVQVEGGGKGMTAKLTSWVDAATGIPGAGQGSMEMDISLKVMGQEMRQVLKMNVTTEPVK
jgi:hypothetical protein